MRAWLLTAALILPIGCTGAGSSATETGPKSAAAFTRESRADLPRLALIERAGAPHIGAAVAVFHGLGDRVSFLLQALVLERLEAEGFSGTAATSQQGFVIRTELADGARVEAFVQAAARAVRDPATRAIEFKGRPRSASNAAGPESKAEAACGPESRAPDPVTTRASAKELTTWQAKLGPDSVAISVVGAASALNAAKGAYAQLEAWPRGEEAEPLSQQHRFQEGGSSDDRVHLSVGVHHPSAAQSFALHHLLSDPNSDLSLRSRNLNGDWLLDSLQVTTQRLGGCVQASWTATSAAEVRDAANLLRQVALTPLPDSGPWLRSRSILEPSDPLEVAQRAAWQALSQPSDAAGPAISARFLDGIGDAESGKLEALFNTKPQASALRAKFEIERGQERLWTFLGSSCGTRNESAETSGRLGWALQSMSQQASEEGVTLTPIVSSDVVGLVASAGRSQPDETRAQQARRVGRVLGRALLHPLEPRTAETERQRLLRQFKSPSPGLELGLDLATEGQLGWLSAWGTHSSLLAQPEGSLEQTRRAFAARSDVLSMLLNSDEDQAGIIQEELTRALSVFTAEPPPCPASPPKSKSGSYEITTSTPSEKVLAIVPLAGEGAELARFTALLLNQNWLPKALNRPGLAAQARASLLGGSEFAALVVEVRALDGKLSDAVDQLRALLGRLAGGALSSADLRSAETAHGAALHHASVSPSERLLGLIARPPGVKPTLRNLQALHARIFRDDALILIQVKPRDPPNEGR